MGTNTDPYQRAEAKFRLTRGVVEALAEHDNPFSILTKSPLVTRDLDVIADAARADQRPGPLLDRHAGRAGLARHRTGLAQSAPAHRGHAPLRRGRRADRRARRPDPARAERLAPSSCARSSTRCATPAAGCSASARSTCDPARASTSCSGWPATTPSCMPTTCAATPPATTRRSATSSCCTAAAGHQPVARPVIIRSSARQRLAARRPRWSAAPTHEVHAPRPARR